MPWTLEDYPVSMSHLAEVTRAKAIDIANALLAEGPRIAVVRAETIGSLELVMDGESRVDGFRARLGRDDHANRVFALPAEPKEFAVIGNTACLRMQQGFLLDVAPWIGHFDHHLRVADPDRHRGIVGLSMDWRVWRQRDAGITDGALNYFVAGAVEKYGTIVWSVDEVVAVLEEWSA